MRHIAEGSCRLASGRRVLGYETLEQRSVLTALIAATEIAPGPVSEFLDRADEFVDTTLERVMSKYQQTREGVVSRQEWMEVGEDGRQVSVKNYTVELGNAALRETAALTSPAGGSLASPAALSATRSSVSFSFMIYADSRVSIRASLNPPQLVSLWPLSAAGKLELPSWETSLRERGLAADVDEGDEFGWSQPVRPQSAAERAASGVDAELGALESPAAAGAEESSDRPGAADKAPAGNRALLDSLLAQMVEVEFCEELALSDSDGNNGSDSDTNRPSRVGQSGAGEPAVDAVPGAWSLALAALEQDLPVPAGMVALDGTAWDAGADAVGTGQPVASGIYQVFVESHDSLLAGGLPAGEAPSAAAEVAWGEAPSSAIELEDSQLARWRNGTLAVATLIGGVVWGWRPSRRQAAESLTVDRRGPA